MGSEMCIRDRGGVWTGGAGAFLPSNSNLNATYTPTAAELTAGQVWIKLTSTGNGVCSAVPDSMLVTFTPTPTANAGPDQTRCANNSLVQLNGAFTVATGGVWSGGSGSFDPSTTNMSAQYTPDAAEVSSGSVTLTMTTTGNGNCVAANDQALINFTAAPVANAAAAASLCANNAVVALNGSVTGATVGAGSGGTASQTPDTAPIPRSQTAAAALRSSSGAASTRRRVAACMPSMACYSIDGCWPAGRRISSAILAPTYCRPVMGRAASVISSGARSTRAMASASAPVSYTHLTLPTSDLV